MSLFFTLDDALKKGRFLSGQLVFLGKKPFVVEMTTVCIGLITQMGLIENVLAQTDNLTTLSFVFTGTWCYLKTKQFIFLWSMYSS